MLKSLAVVGSFAVGASAYAGGITHQYGYDFLPIGDAGNADFGVVDPNSGDYFELYGAVDYEYRISSTVTTATQWAGFLTDFVTAFGYGDVAGTSYDDIRSNYVVGGGDGLMPLAGFEQYAITTPWRGAAIYCNWLHHGQTSDPQKLLTGAYDTSTFGQNGMMPTDNTNPLPGAKYWIPTQDELMKAAYYDPNRYGEGEGGYWTYPDAGEEPLFGAFPEDGGETNAFNPPGLDDVTLPVLSYPDVASAYGLHDLSGMVREFTTTKSLGGDEIFTTLSSAGIDASLAESWDTVLGNVGDSPIIWSRAGFRVATITPAPSSLVLLALGASSVAERRRRAPA